MSLTPSRLLWLTGSAAAILLIAIVAALSPVRINLTIEPQQQPVEAGLPTTTPLPPTTVAPTTIPPTAIPLPPTEVPAAPTAPPREERHRPTATPIPPTVVPATPEARQPQLAILKSVSPDQVKVGERATFTLRLSNLGTVPATDVVITDEVPAQLEVVDLHSTKGDIVVDGQRVTAYPRTIAPGEVQSFSIVVRVREGTTDTQIDNLGLVTLGQPDDPGDNTSTSTLRITPPDRTTQSIPPTLPRTANPDELEIWQQYWPLVVLAFGLFGFGFATRQGAFRQRTLQVTVGRLPANANAEEHAALVPLARAVEIPATELVARWRAGASTRDLVELVAASNPMVDRLAVSIAVQKVLQAELARR